MRVNLEDTLSDDGHLRFLAKAMGAGWDEDRVLAKAYWVYRSTQRAGFVAGSIDRVVTLCVLRFDSDDECRRFLVAMCTAQLAERKGDEIRIFGNEKHVQRFAEFRDRASRGGKSTQQKRSMVSEAHALAHAQAQAKPTLNTPISDLRSPISGRRS